MRFRNILGASVLALALGGVLAGPTAAQGTGGFEFINAQTGATYTFVNTDCGKLVTFSNASAVAATLPQASNSSGTFNQGCYVDVQNVGATVVTITPTTSTIDGLTTLGINPGQGLRLVAGSANYATVRGGGGQYDTGLNLLQNGDFAIDQRNEGASVTLTTAAGNIMTADRWGSVFAASSSSAGNPTAQQVSATTGMTITSRELKLTMNATPSTTVPAALQGIIQQSIEGPDLNFLGFGAAGASPVTLSGWLKSSVASSVISVALQNGAQNRTYAASCTTSATASTWTFCSAVIPGDVAGTWLTSPGTIGAWVVATYACGSTFQQAAGAWAATNTPCLATQTQITATLSATLEFAAWKLEAGTAATPFQADPTQKALASLQRFYRKTFPAGTAPATNAGLAGAFCQDSQAAQPVTAQFVFTPPMANATYTINVFNPSAAFNNWRDVTAANNFTATVDPSTAKSAGGVEIISAAPAAAAHNMCIHATFDTLN